MGRVDSIFKISGGLGDYVFYTLNGKQVVRRKPAKKRGKKSAAQGKIKALNDEFSAVSSAAKLFRHSLEAEIARLDYPALHGAMMKVLLAVKSEDTAEKGHRTVSGGLATVRGREIFKKFKFRKPRKPYLELQDAQRKAGDVTLKISGNTARPVAITELQINFESGKFRRAAHLAESVQNDAPVSLKRALRSRKGFVEFWVVSGEGFLSGVVCGVEK